MKATRPVTRLTLTLTVTLLTVGCATPTPETHGQGPWAFQGGDMLTVAPLGPMPDLDGALSDLDQAFKDAGL